MVNFIFSLFFFFGFVVHFFCIDNLEKPTRCLDTPFRMCVSDVFKNIALGVAVSGKVESGIVGTDDQVNINSLYLFLIINLFSL